MDSKIKDSPRIVFMGTPEFAVPSLRILVENNYNIVGVVTATDKYGGRGSKKLIESDVKKYSISQGLNVLQPKNLKAQEFVEQLKALKADVQMVVAFRMLPEVVWDMPPLGTYNLHGSLLPMYRGAAPINWAIIKGEKETGVTSFKLKHQIDTGDILFQERLLIGNEETAGELYERLKVLGAEVVLRTINQVEEGGIQLREQDNSLITKAPKIHKETCEMNLDQSPLNLFNFVRGLNPYPGAWMNLNGNVIKVFRVEMESTVHDIAPGKIDSDNKSYLKVAVKGGWIKLLDIQMQAKKRMDIKSFLNGIDVTNLLRSNP